MDNGWNNFNIGSRLNNNFNSAQNNMFPMSPNYAPHYEIIRVNGEAGAKNFRMGPNSNALLLDNTAPRVWLAQTDGTGYLTVEPFKVIPEQQAEQVDLNNLAARVAQLEEIINDKSNSFSTKQPKKQRQQSVSATTNDSADQGNR